MSRQVGVKEALPKDAYFDDNLFFEVNADDHVIMATQHTGELTKFSSDLQMRRVSIAALDPDPEAQRKNSLIGNGD